MYSHFLNLLFGEAELAVRLQVLIIAGEHAVRLVLTMAFARGSCTYYVITFGGSERPLPPM